MSMDLPNHLSNIKLNNFIVKLRGKVKQVLVRLSHKMTREIKKYRETKADSEEVKKKKIRKANRLTREMKVMKKLKKDDIAKFAVQFDKNPHSILNDVKAHIKLKVLVKISMNDILKKQIEAFRKEYPNWTVEVPNILRNIELKKKGMKLTDDIQKGELGKSTESVLKTTTDTKVIKTNKIEEKRKDNSPLKKESKGKTHEEHTKTSPLKVSKKMKEGKKTSLKAIKKIIDTQNVWSISTEVKSKENQKAKVNDTFNEQSTDSEDTEEESESDDEQSTKDTESEDSDNSEKDRLAQKLSSALKRIAPGSDEDVENSDVEYDSENSDYEDEKSGIVGKASKGKTNENNVSDGEDSSDEDSEEEGSDDDDDDDNDSDEEEEVERHKEQKKEHKKQNKNFKTNRDASVGNKHSKEQKTVNNQVKNTQQERKIDSNIKDKDFSRDTKEERKSGVKNKDIREEETVVDDFFMTKDNREYKSTVKPNPVAEQGGRDEDVNRSERRRSLQPNSTPKEIYRKGKKIVMNNRNKPSFSNFDKGGFKGNDKGGFRANEKGGFRGNKGDFRGSENGKPHFSNFDKGGNGRFSKGNSNGKSFNDRFSAGGKNDRFGGKAPSCGGGEKLHPSWEAKKRHQPVIAGFQGKKIKFE